MKGIVTNLQGYCLHDGPGIRSVAYLKGCQLCCKWCAMPESQGDAVAVEKSPPPRREWFFGHPIEARELVDLLMKDRQFYDQSGGGVTLSGGDPLYQPDFTYEVCSLLKAEGIHVALDTFGHCAKSTIRNFLDVVNLWLYDVKHVDCDKCMKFTGVSPFQSMDNLRALDAFDADIWIRIAIIPGFNGSPADIDQISSFLATLSPHVISLLPYHIYAADKYKILGRNYEMPQVNMPDGCLTPILHRMEKFNLSPRIGY